MKKAYTAPMINDLGTLQALTAAGGPSNKTGSSSDVFTALSDGAIVGSLGSVGPHRP